MLRMCLIVGIIAGVCISGASLASSRLSDDSYASGGGFQKYIAIGLHSVLSIKGTIENVAAAVKHATGLDD